MKNSLLLGSILVLLGLNSGCSKQETSETPTAPPQNTTESVTTNLQKTGEALQNQATNAAETAQAQANAAQQAVDKAATDVQAQAKSAANAAGNSLAAGQDQSAATAATVQASLDKVRKLIADKNWSDALKELGQLSALKLTPEQQATVDSLKQQVQKMAQGATADQAKQAVGNLLNNK